MLDVILLSLFPSIANAFAASESTAPRFWPKYVGSHTATLLDGTWAYGLHDGVDAADPKLDVTAPSWTPNSTNVPSCIDAVPPGYLGPRATAVYRTTFKQSSTHARLWFGACSFYCRVWVDGKEIGQHRAGGYVPFFLDLPPPAEGSHTLTVLADNRFNKTTAPLHTGGDFWHYGGLMRSVVLHELPSAAAVWRAYVLPWADLATVNVTVVLSDGGFSGPFPLQLSFDGAATTGVAATAVKGTIALTGIKVPSPRVWRTTDPQLHTLSVTSEGGGGVVERFGLRWCVRPRSPRPRSDLAPISPPISPVSAASRPLLRWSVDEATARLALNGEVLKLHGWNHHTQWPGTGAAPTDAQARRAPPGQTVGLRARRNLAAIAPSSHCDLQRELSPISRNLPRAARRGPGAAPAGGRELCARRALPARPEVAGPARCGGRGDVGGGAGPRRLAAGGWRSTSPVIFPQLACDLPADLPPASLQDTQDAAWMALQLQQIDQVAGHLASSRPRRAAIPPPNLARSRSDARRLAQPRLHHDMGLVQRGSLRQARRVPRLRRVRGARPRPRPHPLRHVGVFCQDG